MKKYKVIALSVTAKRGVKDSGDIVTQENFTTPVEELVKQGFLEEYNETKEEAREAAEKAEREAKEAEEKAKGRGNK